MNPDIVQIEVFHIPETAIMKQDHQGDDLTSTHFRPSLGFISQDIYLDVCIKMMAELIN